MFVCSSWSIAFFKFSVSLLIFCTVVLFIIESGTFDYNLSGMHLFVVIILGSSGAFWV